MYPIARTPLGRFIEGCFRLPISLMLATWALVCVTLPYWLVGMLVWELLKLFT